MPRVLTRRKRTDIYVCQPNLADCVGPKERKCERAARSVLFRVERCPVQFFLTSLLACKVDEMAKCKKELE